jgi:hypothetical protein
VAVFSFEEDHPNASRCWDGSVLARLICIQWDNASSKAVTTLSDVRTRPVVHAGIARLPHRHAHAFRLGVLSGDT